MMTLPDRHTLTLTRKGTMVFFFTTSGELFGLSRIAG